MSELIALIIFLAPLAYSPGPGNLFFAAQGARFGLAATAAATFGYHAATLAVTLALGLGFGAALQAAPALAPWLRLLGALYVLHLAWRLARSGALEASGEAEPAGALDGAALLLLNPKAYAIIAAMFAQFLDPASPSFWVELLWISCAFTLNNLIAFTLWTHVGDRLARRWRDPARARILNGALALTLAGVALWLLLG